MLTETIDKLVIRAEVIACYEDHRELISDAEFHDFYEMYLNDQLEPRKRSVLDFREAATKLTRLIREAASEGTPEAVTEHEKRLWEEINEKRGDEWTDDQKRQLVSRRLEAWMLEQGYKTR